MSKKKKDKALRKKQKKKKKKSQEVKSARTSLNLRRAKKIDLVELDKYVTKKGKRTKKWKPFYGFPYWLMNSKGEIEERAYVYTEETDTDEFFDYFVREQVYIIDNG